MSDYQQKLSGSFQERLRLNRLRRRKEALRFGTEFKLVPGWLKGLVAFLYVLALVIAISVNLSFRHHQYGNDMFPYELRDNPVLASLALAGMVTVISLVLGTFILFTGYVNRDAKRRGMNSALWTLVVLVFFPNTIFVGFLIYFLMREPLPYDCPQCGKSVGARYNFCPNCKCNLHPSCPTCKEEVGETDKFCPHCGADLKENPNASIVPATPGPS